MKSPHNLITWNINFSEQTVGEYEEFDWNHRKQRVIDFLIKHCATSIICVQEATEESSNDINHPMTSNMHYHHIKSLSKKFILLVVICFPLFRTE